MEEHWIAFWFGLIAGMFLMGVLLTKTPVIGYMEAQKSKEACEQHLPRDQVCIPNYVPSKEQP